MSWVLEKYRGVREELCEWFKKTGIYHIADQFDPKTQCKFIIFGSIFTLISKRLELLNSTKAYSIRISKTVQMP